MTCGWPWNRCRKVLETDPSAVELMDNLLMSLCREIPSYARLLTFLVGNPNSVLITEYSGDSEAEVKGKLDKLEAFLARRGIGVACVRAENGRAAEQRLECAQSGAGPADGDSRATTNRFPSSRIRRSWWSIWPTTLPRLKRFPVIWGCGVAYYAHASAGCLHVRPLINLKEVEQAEIMVAIAERAVELVAGYDGALSSEHGDGRARSWLNERFFGPDLYRAYQEAKQTFDPENILNPDNIVNAGPMTENLRYGEAYTTIPIKEHIDFSSDIGFHRAVEMCNGAGVCRKDTGTMCPSYMVTRDEEHSTRGRANLLRSALSGALPNEELTSARMYEAMDLCIECKACKAECPSSVDMAKIKFQFLATYYETKPVPFQVRFFANIAFFNRLGSMVAPLANWSLKNRLFRWLLEKAAGIDSRRSLPEFAATPFTSWFKNRAMSEAGETEKTVVLFNDTFNTYNYPQVSIAATEVLEAAGYRVVLPGHWCCGRPMISKGLVDQAKAAAASTVAKLAPFAKEGIPIIGLEPSCLSALIDDYLVLLPDSDDAKAVAKVAVTFEEFMASVADDPEASLPLTPQTSDILLHGHCHQKALIGTAAVKKGTWHAGRRDSRQRG